MKKNLTFHKKKVWTIFLLCAVMMLGLAGRLVYLILFTVLAEFETCYHIL